MPWYNGMMAPQLSVYQDVNTMSRTVRMDYQLPNGQHKVSQVRVADRDLMNEGVETGAVSRIMEHAQEQLKRMVAREMAEWVAQNAQAQQGGNQMVAGWYGQGWNDATGNYYVRYDTAANDCTACGTADAMVQSPNQYVQWQSTPLQGWEVLNAPLPQSFESRNTWLKTINVKFKLGKHTLSVMKTVGEDGSIEITDEDMRRAKDEYLQGRRVQIITRKAESKAEDLLRMFISEVDFRNYKDKGFFTVKAGDKIFRIWKDGHKHIDMWERDSNRGLFVPKNRLCVHTERRVCPPADEALTKLLLIRSGRVIESANLHPHEEKEYKESELVLV